jgi:hypothetical protein
MRTLRDLPSLGRMVMIQVLPGGFDFSTSSVLVGALPNVSTMHWFLLAEPSGLASCNVT